MLTAIVEAPGRCRLDNCNIPVPGDEEIVIKLEGTGVCASDVNVWQGRPWFEYPHPPGRPGHESWGTIHSLGSSVSTVRVGDRVCSFSESAYAQYTLSSVNDVVRLPDELYGKPFPGEPLACAINAFKRCDIHKEDSVAIVGAGFQGLLLTQMAAKAGAHVSVISRRKTALEFAQAMGAQETIELDVHDRAIRHALGITGGAGFDRVIEATGHQWPLDVAAELTRTRGRLIIVGYHQDLRSVNMQQWNWRGIDVINAHERDRRAHIEALWDAVEAVVEGELDIWPLLTHRFSLSQLDKALNMAVERPEGFLKAIILS